MSKPPAIGPGAAAEREASNPTVSHDSWSEVYSNARRWVCWAARRRWPLHAANDDVWAMSVASWWIGGRDG